VIPAEEAEQDLGPAQNGAQPVEGEVKFKHPVGQRLGCSPRLATVQNAMAREPSSKICVPHAGDEGPYKKPGKSI